MQLVSVIIPNYNKGSHLKECLDSVIAQGGIVKEIIVVDDHSDDNSWELLKEYGRRFHKVKVYRNPRKGAQSARNYGFSKSSGKYIQWLDSDDVLGDLKIQEQAISLERRNTHSVVFCGWCHFSTNLHECAPLKSIVWRDYQNPINWLSDAWLSGSMLVPACWLVPRIICEELLWNEDILKNQDGVYFFDVIMKAKELVYSSGVFIYYRRPGNTNVSQQKSEKHCRSVLDTLIHYEIILKREHNSSIKEALAINYLNFIYSISPEMKHLQREAFRREKNLNLTKLPLTGGPNFRKMQRLLGFKIALFIRGFLPS